MMRRKDGKARSVSLYAVIVKHLALCIAAVLACTAVVYFIGHTITSNFWERTDISYLTRHMDKLRSEDYSSIASGGGYRYSGYFEILDENANVIYCSKSNRHNIYTTQMLDFIPDTKSHESFDLEYINESNTGAGLPILYLLRENTKLRSAYDAEDSTGAGFLLCRYQNTSGDDNILTGVMLLDNKADIIYNTIGMNYSRLDRTTLKILKRNTERSFVQKQTFTTNGGQLRYLVHHTGNRSSRYSMISDRTYITCLVIIIFLTILFITLFCIRIVKILRDPLTMLSDVMDDFAANGKPNVPEYSGPKEFEQITGSFDSLERQLVESENERKELEDQRQKLIADISHDLKTPATVIQGYADALAGGLVRPEDLEKYIRIIQSRSTQLTELINTLFEYSRLEHPDIQLDLKIDDFCEYMREYFAGIYDELDTRGSSIVIDIPEERMMLPFDHALMKRVFDNIISNSLKHNGGHVNLYAGIHQDEDEIIVQVGDGGKGISEDLRESIFKPFVVEDSARTSGKGTGLGLSIARKIVKLHGGSIRLLSENETSWSVMFEIRLPKKAVRSEEEVLQ